LRKLVTNLLGIPVLVVLPASSSVACFSALGSRFACVGVAPCGGSLWLSVPKPIQLALF